MAANYYREWSNDYFERCYTTDMLETELIQSGPDPDGWTDIQTVWQLFESKTQYTV